MKIAVITPKRYVKKLLLDRNVKVQMTIADRILDDDELAFEYQKLKEMGHSIILDNGAPYKGESILADLLIKAAQKIHANILVLPDVMNEAKETIRRTIEFIDKYHQALAQRMKLIGVVQGKTEEEWISCYLKMQSIPEVDIIGIGGRVKFQVNNRRSPYKRVDLLRNTFSKPNINPKKPIHILGAEASGHMEYREFSKIDGVSTADTAAPIALALNNISVDIDRTYEEYSLKTNNETILSEKQIKIAMNNIAIFDKMADPFAV